MPQTKSKNRYIKALVGDNPAEAGVASEDLTRELGSRMGVWLRVLIVSAVIGFAIVAGYLLLVGIPA